MGALVLAIALAGPTSLRATDALTGFAKVIDGDTLDIDGQRVRLFGIDPRRAGRHAGRTRGRTAATRKQPLRSRTGSGSIH